MNMKKHVNFRGIFQPISMFAVIIVISLGWKYTWLGFAVPITMLAGIIGSFINGRYMCGNVCPRGAFFDRLLAHISRQKPLPRFVRHKFFQLSMLVFVAALFVVTIWQNPTSWRHWGFVFWLLCTVTTVIGIFLGILYHQRIWCVFCPIGRLSGKIGGDKHQIQLDWSRCIICRKCEKHCPFQIDILQDAKSGILQNSSCLRCYECVACCPRSALKK